MLGSVDFEGDDVVVADFEAGVGTLTRLEDQRVDTVLVVVEATPKSLEVGSRAVGLAREKGVARIVVVANRLRSEDDLATITAHFADCEVVAVPDDPRIIEADRKGVAPIDLDPDTPAVKALIGLAESLSIPAA